MRAKSIIVAICGFFLMGMLSLGALFIYEPPGPPLPILGEAPSFQLKNSDGNPFSSDGLRGNIWVADFFFSSCAGPCPTMAKQMGRLQDTFSHRNDVRLVNFSVNPVHDTPQVLAKYARKHKADPARWFFLTGTEKAMVDVIVHGFNVGDEDALINHSTRFVLVDRKGQIRGYYMGTESEDIQHLELDIERLLTSS